MRTACVLAEPGLSRFWAAARVFGLAATVELPADSIVGRLVENQARYLEADDGIGTTLSKGSGNPYFSPLLPWGGLAAVFAALVSRVFGSPTFETTVERCNEEDTAFAPAGSFADLTSATSKTLEVQDLREIVRFKCSFDAGDDFPDGVHFIMQPPS